MPSDDLARWTKIIAGPDYVPHYQGRAGIYTGGLNAAYFLEVLDRYPNGTMLIRNMFDVGKIDCPKVQTTIEGDLVFPLLRGRAVARWRSASEGHVLIVQNPETQRGYGEAWLQETHPLTWKYLKKFKEQLIVRKAFLKFFDPKKDPFYSMYAVSEHTFAPFKVVWMDISSTVKATVVSSSVGTGMPIPEHTVMFLTTESEDEAHYVAAVLNSRPVDTIVSGYIVDNHLSTHPIENVVIPRFNANEKVHERLMLLSREAHEAAAQGNGNQVLKAEKGINDAVRKLW